MKPRLPNHVGLIPDGNRRWADRRGLPRGEGYLAGVGPGLELLRTCREVGIAEISIYGFTKENVHRPGDQVQAFRTACIEFGLAAIEAGAAFLAVGDASSSIFPDELRPYAEERSPGDIRVNLLVNYGWQWDLFTAAERFRRGEKPKLGDVIDALGSRQVSRVDLVVRWGGWSRLSGFLPAQCAYADIFVVDSLWPDMRPNELLAALEWYRQQEITLGG